MIDVFALMKMLADGRTHSSKDLAECFGVDREAIHEGIHRLIDIGADIEAMHEQSYRLRQRVDLLDVPTIAHALAAETRRLISGIEVLTQTDSTNSHLMREAAAGRPAGQVCLAETQTAGRGRRGHRWISPLAANLYMSLLWRVQHIAATIGRLSLLVAIAVADALSGLGAQNLTLKWPNDVFWRGKKLGGILIEVARNSCGAGYIVIGIGVNVRMPVVAGANIDQPWTELTTVLSGEVPSRNVLAAQLLDRLISALQSFDQTGGMNLHEAWRRYDLLCGQTVELQTSAGRWRGTGSGVDSNGRLLLDIAGKKHAFTCGEISLSTRAGMQSGASRQRRMQGAIE